MAILSRWFAPAVLAAGLGFGAMAAPAPAQAQDDLVRVLVNVADVVLRGGQPYYRHGNYGYDDRLIATRDRYGRLVYYRMAPRYVRSGPPYGNAYGYQRNGSQKVKCNKHGKCKVTYYDARYDRHDRDDDRYYRTRYDQSRYDRRDRYWDARRQRWDD